jgi:hypothetical protein
MEISYKLTPYRLQGRRYGFAEVFAYKQNKCPIPSYTFYPPFSAKEKLKAF